MVWVSRDAAQARAGGDAPLPVCCPVAGAGCGESLQGGCLAVGGSSSDSASGWKGARSPAHRCWKRRGGKEEDTVRPTHSCPGPSHQDDALNGTPAPRLPWVSTASGTKARRSSSPSQPGLGSPPASGPGLLLHQTFAAPSTQRLQGPWA